jgi:hypothetical protein
MKFLTISLFSILVLNSYSQNKDSLITISDPTNYPSKVDLKHLFNKIKHQGDRASCAYFTTCSLIEAEFMKRGKYINLSEQYLIYAGKKTIESRFPYNSGLEEISYVTANLETATTYGVLQEYHSPYQESWLSYGYPCFNLNEQAPAYCYSENRPHAEDLKNKINLKGKILYCEPEIDSILHYVGNKNTPLALIFYYQPEPYENNNGHIEWNDSIMREFRKTENGNHFMVIYGYDLEKQLLYLRNSWSKDWGNKGYGTMSFYDFKKYNIRSEYLTGFEISDSMDIKSIKVKKDKDITSSHFFVKTKLSKEKEVKVSARGNIKDLERHNVMIRSKLVVLPIELDKSIVLDSSKSVLLNSEDQKKFMDEFVRCSWLYIPNTKYASEKWKNYKKIRLSIPKELMNSQSVQELVDSKKYRFFIKTTLYTFTDKDGELILNYKFKEINL